jgi:hypothetical protein
MNPSIIGLIVVAILCVVVAFFVGAKMLYLINDKPKIDANNKKKRKAKRQEAHDLRGRL